MNFSEALTFLKRGGRLTRAGWSHKESFIWKRKGYTADASSSPDPVLRELGGTIEGCPVICRYRRGEDGRARVTGWLPTCCDLFAEDWQIVG